MVDRTETAGKATGFQAKTNSVLNGIDNAILNRDDRSLNEPTIIGKNDISNGKNNSNINSRVFARVSYASIVKQVNRLTRPSNIPVYVPPHVSPVPPHVSPLKMQRSSIVNDLTKGDESLLETLESLCDNNKDHFEEGRMTGLFVSG